MNVLLTPLPLIITFIILSLLWLPKISHQTWARIGRIICLIVIATNICFWLYGINAKLIAGQNQAQALFITRFTKHIEKLIDENKIEKAQQALVQFNTAYPSVAGDNRKTEELTKKLIEEYK
jgi:hypothetical protein